MFCVPFEMLYLIRINKLRTEDAPYLIFVFTCFNCTLWVAYGLSGDPNLLPCFYGNVAGIPIAYFLFVIFLYLSSGDTKKVVLAAIGSFIVIGGTLTLFLFWLNDVNPKITSYTAMTFNILMYAAPISSIVPP